MTDPAIDADSVDLAAALLTYYSFDLAGQPIEQLIAAWLHHHPSSWLGTSVVEALYQGRYKAVSVGQILQIWHRRGHPICHFNREFERMVCAPVRAPLVAQANSTDALATDTLATDSPATGEPGTDRPAKHATKEAIASVPAIADVASLTHRNGSNGSNLEGLHSVDSYSAVSDPAPALFSPHPPHWDTGLSSNGISSGISLGSSQEQHLQVQRMPLTDTDPSAYGSHHFAKAEQLMHDESDSSHAGMLEEFGDRSQGNADDAESMPLGDRPLAINPTGTQPIRQFTPKAKLSGFYARLQAVAFSDMATDDQSSIDQDSHHRSFSEHGS